MDSIANDLKLITNVTTDCQFKQIVSYKGITSMLLKAIIPYYSNLTIDEIAELIVNTRKRDKNIKAKNDFVDEIPTESGTLNEKNIRMDFVFKVNLPNPDEGAVLGSILSVDFEMQQKVKKNELGYSLVSRAIYYGCDMLRKTVPRSDTYYTNIHKVYSIWFCNGSLEKVASTDYEGIQDEYIHIYNFRRNYTSVTDKVMKVEKEADLVEVILIDLPKLKELYKQGKVKDLDKALMSVFYDKNKLANYLVDVKDEKRDFDDKEVVNMLSYYEQDLIEAKTEGIAEGEAKGITETVINFIDNLHAKNPNISIPKLLQTHLQLFGLQPSNIESICKHYGVKIK